MARTRLLWQLFPSYLIVTLAALLAVAGYLAHSLRSFYLEKSRDDLVSRVNLAADPVRRSLVEGDPAALETACDTLSQAADARVTVIAPSGNILCDSQADAADMDNHATRPEVAAAFAGETNTKVRYSKTVLHTMVYVAKRIEADGQVLGVLRLAIPTTAVDEALQELYIRLLGVGLIVGAIAVYATWTAARRITRPLDEIRRGAQQFAEGNLGKLLRVPETREFASLAEAMNRMAAQLDERIRTAMQQRSEQEAVLSSMVEGVIAMDNNERVISINNAAANFLGVSAEKATGLDLPTVIRNAELQRFVSAALTSQKPLEGEIQLHQQGGQVFQAHGAALRDAQGDHMGAVIVINNITHLRRLEQVRRDFVANVSHELKTPITSIKGFVETLLTEAPENTDEARHFLQIVSKQADRLNAIIEDLLTLSRLEQGSQQDEGLLKVSPIKPTLQDAVELCQRGAAQKDIALRLECPDDLEAQINPALLEQGVTNLIDNAIKYSKPRSTVDIAAKGENGEVSISVADQGAGIPPEHLPRLFERFYRVDKARSRNLGGTGLGLSIVKHIAQAHNGRVDVESEPGRGSRFTIYLPNPAPGEGRKSAADGDTKAIHSRTA